MSWAKNKVFSFFSKMYTVWQIVKFLSKHDTDKTRKLFADIQPAFRADDAPDFTKGLREWGDVMTAMEGVYNVTYLERVLGPFFADEDVAATIKAVLDESQATKRMELLVEFSKVLGRLVYEGRKITPAMKEMFLATAPESMSGDLTKMMEPFLEEA